MPLIEKVKYTTLYLIIVFGSPFNTAILYLFYDYIRHFRGYVGNEEYYYFFLSPVFWFFQFFLYYLISRLLKKITFKDVSRGLVNKGHAIVSSPLFFIYSSSLISPMSDGLAFFFGLIFLFIFGAYLIFTVAAFSIILCPDKWDSVLQKMLIFLFVTALLAVLFYEIRYF